MASQISTEEEDVVRTNVSKWLDLTKTIKSHQKKIADLKAAQKMVESEIIRALKTNNIPQFDLPNGKTLKLKTKESKKAVTPKWIKEQLGEFKKDIPDNAKEKIQKIISKIDNRPTTSVKESLVHND